MVMKGQVHKPLDQRLRGQRKRVNQRLGGLFLEILLRRHKARHVLNDELGDEMTIHAVAVKNT